MARGRPPEPKPDGSNLSSATFLELYDEAVDLKAAMDAAQGRYRAGLKKADSLGINREMLLASLKLANQDRDRREMNDRDLRKYMAWLSMPLGAQGDLGLGDPAPNGHDAGAKEESEEDRAAAEKHKGAVAYHQGRDAGKLGANISSNPFTPGNEDYAIWSSGWHEGNRQKAETEAGPKRRGRPRTKAAEQAPAE